jgi:hypothetical protein
MADLSVHRIVHVTTEEKDYDTFKTITVTATDENGVETSFTMFVNDKTTEITNV